MRMLDLRVAKRARQGQNWCLFIDRDGVINTRIVDGYVRNWEEFNFIPGALGALRTLARWAPHIVVVTNQQGVGKSLMTAAELDAIHDRMLRAIAESGGRIDAIQACTHLASAECDCRKPQPGLAVAYLAAHPAIDGSLSIMVGDMPSDIEMGRRLAAATDDCFTVRIAQDLDLHADATFASLADFASAIDEA